MRGIDKMKEELEKIQEFLEIDVSENPEELIERIKTLNVYMARSGRMLAEAKQKLREKKASEISKTILEIAKQNFLSAKEENFLVDWAERINKACTHQVDALRSLLSYEKEQLRLTQ